MGLVILAGDKPVDIETPQGTVHVGPGCCLRIPATAAPEVTEAVRVFLEKHPQFTYRGGDSPPDLKPLNVDRPAKEDEDV